MSSDLTGLINYGVGNLGSIQRMIEKVGGQSVLISNTADLMHVGKIVLPGVGHYSEGARALRSSEFWDPILEFTKEKKKAILGICLGMQLLCKHSEEGDVAGLGLVDASVKKFDFPEQPSLKVPHMGWNTLRTTRENPLVPMDEEEHRFYFVHSYKVVPNNPDISIGQCDYGGEFCAAFQQGNVFGVQFHPEKSHRFGMALMKRFVEL
jgi:glutamine amidotransferase